MIDALAIPPDDRFQVIAGYPADGLIYDPKCPGVQRSDKVVFIQITMSAGRKPQQKRKLYKRIVEHLTTAPGLCPEDVVVSLVEVCWENCSFGNGEAQYMDT